MLVAKYVVISYDLDNDEVFVSLPMGSYEEAHLLSHIGSNINVIIKAEAEVYSSADLKVAIESCTGDTTLPALME